MKRWNKLEEKARKELSKSSDLIRQSARVTRSEKPTSWRLGKSPGSFKGWP